MKKIIFVFLTGFLVIHAGFTQQTKIYTSWEPEQILRKAFEYLGTPYRYGGISPKGVDCSGLAYAVFHEIAGVNLPRGVGESYQSLKKVAGTLLPGDLVFFNTTGGASHLGIFIGGTYFIHAASAGPRTGVIVSSLDEKYYRQRYIGARRILDESPPMLTIELGAGKKIKELTGVLPLKTPVVLLLKNLRQDNEIYEYVIIRDEKPVLQKTIRVAVSSPESVTIIPPSEGQWKILISPVQQEECAEISVYISKGYPQ
ncbi:MAG: C40 family peptidase [Spirochaetales bacterium]|nr:C40 family peptidase [Spirochaetales bacterium]